MTHDRPADRIVGSVRTTASGLGMVRVEDVFDTHPDDLWSAITEPRRTARWIGTVEGDLRVGGDFHAHFTSGWDGPGRIVSCDPPIRLVLAMEPGTDDETEIVAELTPEGDRTRLVVEERGLPVGSLNPYGAGWQVHLEDLGAYLRGNDPQDWRSRWLELSPAYERLAGA